MTNKPVEIPHFQVGERKRLFPVRNDPAESAVHDIEAPADRLHQVGVETVEADEFLVLELNGFVDLLAEQDGAGVFAVEQID